jgi:hypothetical protein
MNTNAFTEGGPFLSRWETISFSRSTHFHWMHWLHRTAGVGVSITVEIRIREVLGSNRGWDTRHPDWDSSWFSPVPLGKFRESPSIRPRLFLPNPFQFINYPDIWSTVIHYLTLLERRFCGKTYFIQCASYIEYKTNSMPRVALHRESCEHTRGGGKAHSCRALLAIQTCG